MDLQKFKDKMQTEDTLPLNNYKKKNKENYDIKRICSKA